MAMTTTTKTVTKRTCDIFKTTKKIKRYRVQVQEMPEDLALAGIVDLIDTELDLGERAKDRLISYVQRGITRPSDKQK